MFSLPGHARVMYPPGGGRSGHLRTRLRGRRNSSTRARPPGALYARGKSVTYRAASAFHHPHLGVRLMTLSHVLQARLAPVHVFQPGGSSVHGSLFHDVGMTRMAT